MRHGFVGLVLGLSLALAAVAAQETQRRQPAGTSKAAPAESELEKAIDEFKVITDELGLRPGSEKRRKSSGPPPEYHGRLYWNLRNDVFDAIPHEIVQNGGGKRPLRRSQFGFNISGPVYLPKVYNGGRRTFFSLSYEGMRERIGRSYLSTIANEFERTGDWSRTVDQAGNPLPIYDPNTTRPNPNYDPAQPVSFSNPQYQRDLFPGAKIPQSRIDPVARKAIEYYPLPNVARGPFFRNNFFIVSNEVNNASGLILKVDHNLTERQRLSVGVTYSDGLNRSPERIKSEANPGGVDYSSANRSGSLSHIFTLSPNEVNDFSFSVDSTQRRSATAEADFAGGLGLNGVGAGAFPYFNFSNYLDMGRSYPLYRNARNTYRFEDTFSYRFGTHNLRLTGQLVLQQVNTVFPQYPAGLFRFSANQTALPGVINTGHEFASFELGQADYAELTDVLAPSYFRQSYRGAGLFDNYELKQGLQLSYGAWFSWRTPRIEKYNRQSTVDLSAPNPEAGKPGALIFAQDPNVNPAFRPTSFVLEPRFSISWSPVSMPGTVIRSSVSRSYSQIPIYYGQWGTQGYTGVRTFISPNPQLDPAAVLGSGLPPSPYPLPDLRPEAADNTVAHLIRRDNVIPSYDYYSLSLERQFPLNLIVRFVGGRTRGRNVLAGNQSVNYNAIPIDAMQYRDVLNDEAVNRQARPYPQFRGFDVYDSSASGWYNDDYTYVTVEKRGAGGLTLSGQYRFSKQMDNYSSSVQDYHHLYNEKSLSTFHRPHRFTITYSYDLPADRLAIGPGWTKRVWDGWTISGSSQLYSGDPVRLQPSFNNTGRVVPYLHVNVVPGVDPNVPDQGPALWFNPDAFAQPPDFTIGDASRTHPQLLNPPYQNHDVSIRKRISLSTERSIELTAVGLNFVNTANWNDPDSTIGPANAPNVNAGKIIGSRGGRIIQVGLRFNF